MMKKILLALLLGLLFKVTVAQTNVSGGIYTNTTWTLVNSPYIVVDTVVVFPGVTLTIEPGVVVKFNNNKYLEIRQAVLTAIGTVTDSITFTSNSGTPSPGIWGGIRLNYAITTTAFNFCNVSYAFNGIDDASYCAYIKNSTFTYNQTGVYRPSYISIDSCTFRYNNKGIEDAHRSVVNFCTISNNTTGITSTPLEGLLTNCTIDSNETGIYRFGGVILNCTIRYNQTGLNNLSPSFRIENSIISYNSVSGIITNYAVRDTIINCVFKYNGVGLNSNPCSVNRGIVTQNVFESNNIGIQLYGCDSIFCNRICNNTTYDVENVSDQSRNVVNNYWCTSDSLSTTLRIFDGYDDITRGLVTFMPMDSVCAIALGIPEQTTITNFTIYPNPARNTFTISFNEELRMQSAELRIYDITGRVVYEQTLNHQSEIITHKCSPGVYFVKVNAGEKEFTEKLVVE
jgi:hypothetical protein